jgi:hypothetical protein
VRTVVVSYRASHSPAESADLASYAAGIDRAGEDPDGAAGAGGPRVG